MFSHIGLRPVCHECPFGVRSKSVTLLSVICAKKVNMMKSWITIKELLACKLRKIEKDFWGDI